VYIQLCKNMPKQKNTGQAQNKQEHHQKVL
jgi:hypothetical protein